MDGEVGGMGGKLVRWVAKLVKWVTKLVRWMAMVIEMHGLERHCLLRQLPGFESTHLSKKN